ncbi:hypothetical protein BRYFOR_05971 [Marvinbryantia formatexigens DSM 14469]|uniref:Uncharacterized protein n=1 Tax=Marvinbryantia formatexigens DSM 14469 TaxID=478749 RepID=C6LBH5_9FIRM|nr:hypothetical protein BRYFOR_05971 [Marvinbryantia formatexigens DSM 14469]
MPATPFLFHFCRKDNSGMHQNFFKTVSELYLFLFFYQFSLPL